jgi:chromosome segregation ATPase
VANRLNLEQERKLQQGRMEENEKKLKKIEEGGKKRTKEFHKEIKDLKKNKDKTQERIQHIEKKMKPLFEWLGKRADETRINQEDLSSFYSQIDRSKGRIEEIEQQIRAL